MLQTIDSLLDRITMYRVVLYYLAFLVAASAVFGFLGILPYSPVSILASVAIILVACLITNAAFARIFGAQTNVESVYITALILALIITPLRAQLFDAGKISFLIWAGVWAMASKYILAARKKHIFNPAAFAVLLTSFTINQAASWWVGGNLPLFGFVLVGGFLVVRKIRRFDLIIGFLAAACAAIALSGGDPAGSIQRALLHSPILFFAFIMLTEPLTTPPTRPLRIAYGVLVGLLFAPQVHLFGIYSTPELALVVGNIFSYLVSPKERYMLRLEERIRLSPDVYDFVFSRSRPLAFAPGQYMEWTLEHPRPDSRGNRRYFTIASSPTEETVRVGIKFSDRPSSFKRALLTLEPGTAVSTSQLAGDFTLPRDAKRKLAFLAGGIGVTPFRSMIRYLLDRGERRDIVLVCSNRTAAETVYRDVFDAAAKSTGVRVVYAITDDDAPAGFPAHRGRIDAALLAQEIPDFRERTFYLSGPHGMVIAFRALLRDLGVSGRNIKEDYFPGFA